MRPRRQEPAPQEEMFRNRLENLIDQGHELVRLAGLIEWEEFDRQWGPLFSQEKGAPALPTRLIAGLHYLKHLYKLSDEEVVRGWVENPYHQYFCGESYFQHQLPIHPTSMSRWRSRIGEEGCEWLLTQTIEAGRKSGVLKDKHCRRVNVDTTVQEKAVAFPTDSKLLDDARRQLVKLAKDHEIPLRQNYNRVAKRARLKISRYAHAKQYRRMHAEIKKLRTRVGRVVRDIERKIESRDALCKAAFAEPLATARRVIAQRPKDKNKLYSVYAPEVECLSKGKAHKRYEFGVKATFATTSKTGFVVGARSLPGSPYDGHTLAEQLEQVQILTGIKPDRAYADRGYRGHGVEDTEVFISGQKRGVTRTIRKELRHRSAIEPEIGHMKNDGHLGRCFLKGQVGDAINVLLVAAGHNLRKILAWLRGLFAWLLGIVQQAQYPPPRLLQCEITPAL